MIRLLKRLAAPLVNAVIDRLNDATDRHNARVAEQSRQAVEQRRSDLRARLGLQSRQAVEQWTERTPVSPRVEPDYPEGAYIVFFDGGERRRFTHWPDAREFYRLVHGYGLVNKDRLTDGGNYAGLTEEQRGEIGL